MKKKLYIIAQGDPGFMHCNLVADDGEALYDHLCSHEGYAKSDLIMGRKDRIEECNQKYGENGWEVLFLDEDPEMSMDELLKRNKQWYEQTQDNEKETDNRYTDNNDQ